MYTPTYIDILCGIVVGTIFFIGLIIEDIYDIHSFSLVWESGYELRIKTQRLIIYLILILAILFIAKIREFKEMDALIYK
jgi:hypothetical protein